MTTQTTQTTEDRAWQRALSEAVTDLPTLLSELGLHDSARATSNQESPRFPIRVPRSFIARMEKNNPNDPLLLQVLAQSQERTDTPGFSTDPLKEQDTITNPIPGLLHKYAHRVLLILTGSCAVHCRYCFRQHFPYTEQPLNKAAWDKILQYVQTHTDIREVILSGGDPLMLKDPPLFQKLTALSRIPHLHALRLHTRLPMVLPERITAAWLQAMKALPLRTVVVVHSNHPQEIDTQVGAKLLQMHKAGITVLNQSVLLKGINDNVAALTALSQRLFEYHTLPYYLHMLDPVQGAAHFAVEDTTACALQTQLLQTLPGYLVPRLVRETADAGSKIPVRAAVQAQ